jgi:hypothetical protein
MTTPQILTLIFTLRFFLQKPDNTATKITSAFFDTQVMVSSSDTVKKLLVDDYPVKIKCLPIEHVIIHLIKNKAERYFHLIRCGSAMIPLNRL